MRDLALAFAPVWALFALACAAESDADGDPVADSGSAADGADGGWGRRWRWRAG